MPKITILAYIINSYLIHSLLELQLMARMKETNCKKIIIINKVQLVQVFERGSYQLTTNVHNRKYEKSKQTAVFFKRVKNIFHLKRRVNEYSYI